MNDVTDKNKDKNETAKSFAGMIAGKVIDGIKAIPLIGFVVSFFIDGQKDNIANMIQPIIGGAIDKASSAVQNTSSQNIPSNEKKLEKQPDKPVVPLETPVVAAAAKDKGVAK